MKDHQTLNALSISNLKDNIKKSLFFWFSRFSFFQIFMVFFGHNMPLSSSSTKLAITFFALFQGILLVLSGYIVSNNMVQVRHPFEYTQDSPFSGSNWITDTRTWISETKGKTKTTTTTTKQHHHSFTTCSHQPTNQSIQSPTHHQPTVDQSTLVNRRSHSTSLSLSLHHLFTVNNDHTVTNHSATFALTVFLFQIC